MRVGDLALASALESIPVFPLPGVVLFPGAMLPLHVFEPRYRALLADALGTHNHMAVAFLLGESTDGRPPPIARVAGVGLIVRHTELKDGRSNIVLEGKARVSLDELPFRAPYRRARARLLAEVDSPVRPVDVAALYGAATAFLACFRGKEVETSFELPIAVGAGVAADACAHSLVIEAATRQRILEELDASARVRLVTDALAEQTARVALESRPASRGAPD